MTRMCVVLCAIVLQGLAVLAGGNGTARRIDVTKLPYSDEIKNLISQHIPLDMDSILTLTEWAVAPEHLFHCVRVYYPATMADSADSIRMVVYITDELGSATLQFYAREGGQWHFMDELRDVTAGYLTQISEQDIDCDGVKEVIIMNAAGAGGMSLVDIIGVADDTLQNLTRSMFPTGYLFGRSVEFFSSDSICVDSIRVYVEDGPQRFQPTKKQWLRYDRGTKKYKVVSETPLPESR